MVGSTSFSAEKTSVVEAKTMEKQIVLTNNQGYFKFLNKFAYFYSSDCYWLNNEYDANNELLNIHFDFAGEIAGSGLTLDIACRNFMYHTGCSVCEAFKFASYNPSVALGLYDVGHIGVGNKANLIVVDQFFNVKKIMFKGDII